MEVKKIDQPTSAKPSAYLAARSPPACFLPACHKPFDGSAFHGKDGHYYCSPACAEVGHKIDLSCVEELRPKALPSPQQKLSIGKR
jgi:hypothetical protein